MNQPGFPRLLRFLGTSGPACRVACLSVALAFGSCGCSRSPAGFSSDRSLDEEPWKIVLDDRPPAALEGIAAATSSARFTDVAQRCGISFVYRDGQEARCASIVESVGGGLAGFDFDRDGDVDLLISGGGTFGRDKTVLGLPPAVYRNDGPWSFADVTEKSRLNRADYYSHGAVVGDLDNDGFPDALMTGYGGLMLYHNQGDGTFAETAKAAGLTDTLWSTGAAWGDVDGDGSLDLYVAHYVNWSFENDPRCYGPEGQTDELCGPRDFDPLPDTLYLGNGDGSFRDASRGMGLRQDGKGLGVLLVDLDDDGNLDIYVGNDATPNFLYRNHGRGVLEEIGLVSGTGLGERGEPDGSMGLDAGDFDLDGRLDLWAANYEQESFALYRNDGQWLFRHISRVTGIMAVGQLYVGWGTVALDFDRDGDEDLFVSNGHVIRYPSKSTVRQLPLLFENRGQRFVNVAQLAGPYMESPHLGRGVAAADFDDDGDLDLAVSHINEPVSLLCNETAGGDHWLSVRLIGTRSNRDAVGSVVRLAAGGRRQIRQVKGGGSFASSSDPRLFFGLGDIASVERLEIRWPSGVLTVLADLRADHVITVTEPDK